jgi:hypothetical protein
MTAIAPPLKATIKYGILQSLKYMKEQDPSIDTNELFRHTMLGKFDREAYLAFYAILSKIIYAGHIAIRIQNRPKYGCEPGECYANSYFEWKRTGNKPVLVAECVIAGNIVSVSPHAINVSSNGVFYDTDDFQHTKRGSERLAFILKDTEEMMPWLTKYAKDRTTITIPTSIYGDWMLFNKDNSVWAVHCLKTRPGCDDNKTTFTTMSHYDRDEAKELIKNELERAGERV